MDDTRETAAQPQSDARQGEARATMTVPDFPPLRMIGLPYAQAPSKAIRFDSVGIVPDGKGDGALAGPDRGMRSTLPGLPPPITLAGRSVADCHIGHVVRAWNPQAGCESRHVVMESDLPGAFPAHVCIQDAAALGWYQDVDGTWRKASSPKNAMTIAEIVAELHVCGTNTPNNPEDSMKKDIVAVAAATERPMVVSIGVNDQGHVEIGCVTVNDSHEVAAATIARLRDYGQFAELADPSPRDLPRGRSFILRVVCCFALVPFDDAIRAAFQNWDRVLRKFKLPPAKEGALRPGPWAEGAAAPAPQPRSPLFWLDNGGDLCCGDPPAGLVGTDRILSADSVAERYNWGRRQCDSARDALLAHVSTYRIPDGPAVMVVRADTRARAVELRDRIGERLSRAARFGAIPEPKVIMLALARSEGLDFEPVADADLEAAGFMRLTDTERAVIAAMRRRGTTEQEG